MTHVCTDYGNLLYIHRYCTSPQYGFFSPLLKRQADFHCFLWDKALSSVEECLPVSCDRPHSPLAWHVTEKRHWEEFSDQKKKNQRKTSVTKNVLQGCSKWRKRVWKDCLVHARLNFNSFSVNRRKAFASKPSHFGNFYTCFTALKKTPKQGQPMPRNFWSVIKKKKKEKPTLWLSCNS